MKDTKYFPSIDLAKIFAICWIVLYHLLDERNNWQLGIHFDKGDIFQFFLDQSSFFIALIKSFLSIGVIGVNMFFLLSGLGLCLMQNRNNISFLSFLKRRFLRLFPLYLFLIFSIFFVHFIKTHSINYPDLLTHTFAIHGFFPEFVYSISTPLWFISVIAQLYLLFPLLFRISKKINSLLFLLIAVLIQYFLSPWLVDIFGNGRFFAEFIVDFSVGIILGNIFFKNPTFLSSEKFLFFIIPFFFLFYLNLFRNEIQTPILLLRFLNPLISLTIFISLFPLGNLFSENILKKLSNLSFPVFLTHYIILTKVFYHFNDLSFLIIAAIFLVVSFFVAYLLDISFSFISKILNSCYVHHSSKTQKR